MIPLLSLFLIFTGVAMITVATARITRERII